MKKLALMAVAALSALPMFAAEGDDPFSGVTTQMSSLTDSLKNWMGSALPIILGVAAVFLAPWLFKLVIRHLKSLASKG